jgi:SWI/SNF-related matrix-associated actin-dependent regulator 1 of chromatin subfamily A
MPYSPQWIEEMSMLISYVSGKFVAESSYAEKDAVKLAGFRWNPDTKKWWTDDSGKASKLAEFADDSCRTALATVKAATVEAFAASRATDSAEDIPCPDGLAYLPYQKAGIAYALSRLSTLIGDEMGLGKTIQAIGIINADPSICSVMVICPASLRLNWRKELEKWLIRPLSIGIAGDSFPSEEIAIINYDILKKHHAAIRARSWDILIVDEAHYLKNADTIRTQQIIGFKPPKKGPKADKPPIPPITALRRVFMTGTPVCNRPWELWPLVSSLDPDGLGKSFFPFAIRYCAGHQNSYGWDFSGSSHLDELQEKLRATFMVRRLKSQVLTELPAKRRQVIELPANGAVQVIEAERRTWALQEESLGDLRVRAELAKASDDPAIFEAAVRNLRKATQVAFEAMSKCRHDTALAKVPHVVEHVRDAIDASGKIILFAHHHDVVNAILAEFPDAAVITGQTEMEDRQAAVERFQSDPACSLFIGTIGAAGVGHTLTAASHVVFAELDWVPGNVTQAEDRCHRIGQTDAVLVQHLVLEGSLDAHMANTLVDKQAVIDSALDKNHPDQVEIAKAVIVPVIDGATSKLSRKQVGVEAGALSFDQVSAIHRGLRILAGNDSDFAQQKNDIGYSRYDVSIGHSLAESTALTPRQAVLGHHLIIKYHRQLPTDLVGLIKGVKNA